jgi:IS30 family transposase
VVRKTAKAARKATLALLKPYQPWVLTLTSDNSREFAEHERISRDLQADYYFARPYASWQRGSNETNNGLIRHYFPKHRDFSTITPKEINLVTQRLNSRPRQRLSFRTPKQYSSN